MYIILSVYIRKYNITYFIELIVFINIKSNMKSFPVNNIKRREDFCDNVTRVSSRFFISIFY